MTTTAVASPASAHAPVEAKSKPVLWWAGFGALSLGMALYVWARWIGSSNFHRVPTGRTPIPDWMRISAVSVEVIGVLAQIAAIWFWLIRPWLRERHISFDGLFFLACWSLYWQDPLYSYTQYAFMYNSVFWNMGSWANFVPGWMAPHAGRFPEPVLFSGLWFGYFLYGSIVLMNKGMVWAKKRWPSLGPLGLISFAIGVLMFADFFMEVVFIRLGFYVYPGSLKGWTVFFGKTYGFPIYESILFGVFWGLLASVRYFKNDKGETIVERGIDEVRFVGSKRKTLLRFLAMVGIINMLNAFGYNLPIQLFTLHSAAWPKSVVEKSYFTNGICGPETNTLCVGGPGIPIVTRGSAHFTQDGQLVYPKGVRPPTPVNEQVTK